MELYLNIILFITILLNLALSESSAMFCKNIWKHCKTSTKKNMKEYLPKITEVFLSFEAFLLRLSFHWFEWSAYSLLGCMKGIHCGNFLIMAHSKLLVFGGIKFHTSSFTSCRWLKSQLWQSFTKFSPVSWKLWTNRKKNSHGNQALNSLE